MPYKIFICYRRANIELARGIESRLVQEFGTDSVFLDVEDIHGGQEWKKSITKALKGDPIVVTLITTRWNSRRGGQPKLMDLNDHVRIELETALSRGLTIVPVVYDRASLPQEKQLPRTLHPLLNFQQIPFSSERWVYDLGRLVNALRDLLNEEPKEGKVKINYPNSNPLNRNLLHSSPFSRSMFTLSPEQEKEYAEKAKREEKRKARAREELPKFYMRTSFWIAVVITFVLSAGSIFGAELLVQSVAREIDLPIDLPYAPLFAGIVLACVWSVVWIVLGASVYSYDPELGPKVFFTQGILGGWILGYEDFEPIGYWAAFPLSTALLWIVARGLAMLAFYYLQWNYLLIFWIALGIYTLPVLFRYSLIAGDEWT